MVSFNIFTNFNKEELWLENYAKKGYLLCYANSSYYRFIKINNIIDSPRIKIDFRLFMKNDDFINYCAMFEDSGWKHIAGTKMSGPQYFIKFNPNAPDDIFSDRLSKAIRYRKLSCFYLIPLILYLPLLRTISINHYLNILHFKSLYYTPGLWGMHGIRFIAAFLFETPFALGRALSAYIILIIFFLFLYYGTKPLLMYRKELKS